MSGPDWIITTREPMSVDHMALLQSSWNDAKVVVLPAGAELRSTHPEALLTEPLTLEARRDWPLGNVISYAIGLATGVGLVLLGVAL